MRQQLVAKSIVEAEYRRDRNILEASDVTVPNDDQLYGRPCERCNYEGVFLFLVNTIMKELRIILSYDYSEDGWAIMFGGSSDNMVISGGQQLTQCLINITSWGSVIQGPDDFVSKMKGYYQPERHTVEHCISQMLCTE